MRLSLRNLFRGRRATRGSARSGNATRLHLETLEGRDVPAVMNLMCYTFYLPSAKLTVSNENVVTGDFWGTFTDASSNITMNVSGHLQPIGPNLDKMDFHGVGVKGPETEQVVFNGDLHESLFPLMFGTLTESYSLPIARWTVSRQVETYGRPCYLPLVASQSVLTDALFAGASSQGVSVNPQPLPPHNLPSL
jgi:hypothetical protein